MKRIGMIGGFGPEATLDYYRLLIETYRKEIKDGSIPEIIIYSMDVNILLNMVTNKQWDTLVKWLVNGLEVLHKAGANIGFISANTPHIVFDRVNELSPIPLLSIVEETCKHIDKLTLRKVALLTEKIKGDKKLIVQLIELLKTGTNVEKGTCAEILKFVSKDQPEILAPYIDLLIDYIDYQAPRVKWGVPESIGNLAQKYPEKVEKAIPKLLINTKDKSTVVRWRAAFALTEIAKHNHKLQKDLVSKFDIMVKTEQNNGVKNMYLKALKVLKKK